MNPRLAHLLEQPQQRASNNPRYWRSDHGFMVVAELNPGDLLHQLLQRTDAARQCDKCVGALEHQHFSLMQRRHLDVFVHPSQRHLVGRHVGRLDAVTRPPGLQRLAGDFAHQADAGAAIDEADALFGHRTAQRAFAASA